MKKNKLIFIAVFLLTQAIFSRNIALTAPNGGEAWPSGSRQLIAWTFTTDMPEGTLVKLVLFKGGTGSENKIGNIVQNIPIGARGSGSYEWMAGRHEGGGAAVSAGYYIRVITMDGGFNDYGDRPFAITAGVVTAYSRPLTAMLPPSIKVLRPNGGERYRPGDIIPIRWECRNVPPQFLVIKLISTHLGDRDLRGNILPPRVFEILVCPACPSDFGVFDYTVSDRIASDRYLVSIATVDHLVSDISDGMFQIFDR